MLKISRHFKIMQPSCANLNFKIALRDFKTAQDFKIAHDINITT